MGVSQMLGARPASIASPTDANRTVVYLGILPRAVWRHAHAKETFRLENRVCGVMLRVVRAARAHWW